MLYVVFIVTELYKCRSGVPLNLRRMVYGYGIENTGDDEWRTVWDRYLTATSGQERDHMMYALAQTTRLWLVQR